MDRVVAVAGAILTDVHLERLSRYDHALMTVTTWMKSSCRRGPDFLKRVPLSLGAFYSSDLSCSAEMFHTDCDPLAADLHLDLPLLDRTLNLGSLVLTSVHFDLCTATNNDSDSSSSSLGDTLAYIEGEGQVQGSLFNRLSISPGSAPCELTSHTRTPHKGHTSRSST